jgi:AcrR family transcriptional regulator
MSKPAPPPLSRERIVDAASRLIQRDGLSALSMRRLAQELDVWPMAVYHWFRDKEALLDAVAASTAGSIELPSADEPWREQLRTLLHGAHEAMARDPAGMGASLARAFLAPEAMRLSEAALAILVQAGLSTREAASAWRALWSYTYGFATFRLGAEPDEVRRRTRTAIAGLADDEFPTLLDAVGETASAMADDAELDYGLDRLLDGIEARVGVGRSRHAT